MRDEHIKGILEGAPLGQLSAAELETVRAHAALCGECGRAFEAARVASELLRARAAEEFEPSPFFQTRVLAALRARRAEEEVPALRRLWRAAGVLASSMAASVALLAALTFVAPGVVDEGQAVAVVEPSAAEAMVLGVASADEEMDDEAVFSTLYASGESDE